jgi:hypothetical protein
MWQRIKKYHASLLSAGAALDPSERLFHVQSLAFPWFLPVLGAIVVAVAVELAIGSEARFVAALLCVPSLVGLTYALATFMYSAVRADIRRLRHR